MKLTLLGIGTAQPDHLIEQSVAAELAVTINGNSANHARTLEVLYRRSGVSRRGSVLLKSPSGGGSGQSFFVPPEDDLDRGPSTEARMAEYAAESPALALAAATRALADADVPFDSITHLVTASCTGFAAPGFDIVLMDELPLAPTVTRTHVGFMGCHAAINAMRVAAAMVASDPGSRALVCTTELCSLHFQYGQQPDSMVSNALFADGAAAIVLGDQPASPDDWSLVKTGSCLFPSSQQAMTWNIGDHGFEMRLSNRVPELIAQNLRPWFESWLAEAGFTLAQVGSWAIHPGGPRIVSAVMSALDLPCGADDVSRQMLAECGNMSSPTILFILEELRRRQSPRPCVAIGFGPGLVVEAALFL
jgi:predicted naringenin-chalcone synthase